LGIFPVVGSTDATAVVEAGAAVEAGAWLDAAAVVEAGAAVETSALLEAGAADEAEALLDAAAADRTKASEVETTERRKNILKHRRAEGRKPEWYPRLSYLSV
jgi:hypothetical protein